MLTQLEQKVLVGIANHIDENGHSPTIAEIAARLNIRSRGTVHRYVQSLIKKDCLIKEGNGWRGLRLLEQGSAQVLQFDGNRSPVETTSELMPVPLPGSSIPPGAASIGSIPMLGRIAAGLPIEALPDESQLDLAAFFIGPDRYALRVTGDSMMDAGIMDGDTVILHSRNTARSGDIVVALIDEMEATLKRLGEYSDTVVELIPENSTMAPMRYSAARVSIQGVLVGQLRSY